MPEKRNAIVGCEDCEKTTENLFADGFINVMCQSIAHPENPGGTAFLCADCFRARSAKTGRVMPQQDMREVLRGVDPSVLPPRPALPAESRQEAHAHPEFLRDTPEEGLAEPRGLVHRVRDFFSRFTSGDSQASISRADLGAIQAYLAYKAYEEEKIELQDRIIAVLRVRGSEPRSEIEIAGAVRCSLSDAKSALSQMMRDGLVYPVGVDGWAFGQRAGSAGSRFRR